MLNETDADPVRYDVSLLTEQDIYLFREGNHFGLFDKLGAHCVVHDDEQGVVFAVWAPNARSVGVMGNFNGWSRHSHPLKPRWDGSGIWEGFIAGLAKGEVYKYAITSVQHDYQTDKGDPFALYWEKPPRTGSVIWDLDYEWHDQEWMHERQRRNALDAPWSIYEMHMGSWRRAPEANNRFLTYRELAEQLPPYLEELGYTHVEFLPVMEHPFYGSWGYQTTGYFAPTSRYGCPQDFMYLIEQLHRHGIGVILDWVPSHFPSDQHGLSYFDGTYLFEHRDPRKGFHPEWNSYIFNYGRNEVREFLISSAMFWLSKYHVDALRVDAVASMLYLDYGRGHGEWIPNEYGGKENTQAIAFLRQLNATAYKTHPDTQMIAEESTAWPMVSRPLYVGGLGFGMKWNMGWMHDTLYYFTRDPLYRSYHHDQLTFGIWYAFAENFLLPLSHDEVTYGKGSLLQKMPGDAWQKMANLRALLGYMYGHPGKKLVFMGAEIAQWNEWYHEQSLDWHLLEQESHRGMQHWVRDLNHLYRSEPALHCLDFSQDGFEWIDVHDWPNSVISFVRKDRDSDDTVLVVCNFTPVPRLNYIVGVPHGGYWKELANSDATIYGGSGLGNLGGVEAAPVGAHGRYHSLYLTLPPLAVVFFKRSGGWSDIH